MIDKIIKYKLGEEGLKLFDNPDFVTIKMIDFETDTIIVNWFNKGKVGTTHGLKPILRPLKEFIKTSTIQGVKELGQMFSLYGLDGIRWGEAKFLLDNFVDIFNLIDQGKAVAYDPEKHNKCYE